MSFEKPERILTKEEWDILSQAAQDKAGDYLNLSGAYCTVGKIRLANFYAKKGDKIYKVLIDLENEYYNNHPDEDRRR